MEGETLISSAYPGTQHVEMVQSCIRAGLDRTSGSIWLPRAWSNTGTNSHQGGQCLRAIWKMPSRIYFNFWLVLNWSGTWTRCSLFLAWTQFGSFAIDFTGKGQIFIPSFALCSHPPHPHPPQLPSHPQPGSSSFPSYHQGSPHEFEVLVDVEQGQGLSQGSSPAGLCWVCGPLAVAEQQPGRGYIGVIIAGREKQNPEQGCKMP